MQLYIQACAHVEGCHIEEMSQNDPLRRGQTSPSVISIFQESQSSIQ